MSSIDKKINILNEALQVLGSPKIDYIEVAKDSVCQLRWEESSYDFDKEVNKPFILDTLRQFVGDSHFLRESISDSRLWRSSKT